MKTIKILFLIRDKFGESVLSACAALDYAHKNPHKMIHVFIRYPFSTILRHEKNIVIHTYYFRQQAFLLALVWRLCAKPFDILCVLAGFGKQTAQLVRLIPAVRKIVPVALPVSFPAEISYARHQAFIYQPLLKYNVDHINVFDAGYTSDWKLELPELKKRYQKTAKQYIVICPTSSECRRDIPEQSLVKLVEKVQQDAQRLGLIQKVVVLKWRKSKTTALQIPWIEYQSIEDMINIFLAAHAYYGVDSGHYHLAAAMGLPCTVFFGPSEPHFAVLDRQDNATGIRLARLGQKFCPVIHCKKPYCTIQGINEWLHESDVEHPSSYPEACLLLDTKEAQITVDR